MPFNAIECFSVRLRLEREEVEQKCFKIDFCSEKVAEEAPWICRSGYQGYFPYLRLFSPDSPIIRPEDQSRITGVRFPSTTWGYSPHEQY